MQPAERRAPGLAMHAILSARTADKMEPEAADVRGRTNGPPRSQAKTSEDARRFVAGENGTSASTVPAAESDPPTPGSGRTTRGFCRGAAPEREAARRPKNQCEPGGTVAGGGLVLVPEPKRTRRHAVTRASDGERRGDPSRSGAVLRASPGSASMLGAGATRGAATSQPHFSREPRFGGVRSTAADLLRRPLQTVPCVSLRASVPRVLLGSRPARATE